MNASPLARTAPQTTTQEDRDRRHKLERLLWLYTLSSKKKEDERGRRHVFVGVDLVPVSSLSDAQLSALIPREALS